MEVPICLKTISTPKYPPAFLISSATQSLILPLTMPRKSSRPKQKLTNKLWRSYLFIRRSPGSLFRSENEVKSRYIVGSYAVRLILKDMCEAVELNDHVADITNLIKSLSIKGRPLPTTVNPSILGMELKLCLAAKAPLLMEKSNASRRTTVSEVKANSRFVPVYDIDEEQDPTLICQIKVKTYPSKRNR
ncbi:hypothetical protein CHS0354_033331 [Potamilus streckersoni]|uniref:Uncharacterized protein n=1 Tax=Potamilus streckersoni TaxID=2493646 RepID=A0AAE0VIM7_9BIVA|nr:hypothetical protein CHS0354_033331 [Potamilus streckersoni]